MNRGGVGSASIVLIFAVLCMAIFTAISFISALTERNLIEAEVQMVQAFYAADSLAENILAEILNAEDEIPESILGIEVEAIWDWDSLVERVRFIVEINEDNALYVEVAIGLDGYDILQWRMAHLGYWEADETLDVWQGYFDDDFIESW